MGFPYSDVPRLGVAVIAYSRDSQSHAEDCAEDLARFTWKLRDSFSVRHFGPEAAVKMAMSAPEGPVVLVEAADNIGGGSPGDGTVLFDALLAGGATDFVIVLADPEGVERASAAGDGTTVTLRIGGKHDAWHGNPVEFQGKVRLIADASFHYKGSYMTGLKVNPGRSAVIESGGIEMVLTERRVMPFDAEQLRCLGVEPARKRIVVVKSAVAWKAAYGDIAKKTILVDTPGICSNNLHRFTYHNIPRPIHPLDLVSLDPI
jgi:microcystin degradation protein MlrC